jgi:hypothetical protein
MAWQRLARWRRILPLLILLACVQPLPLAELLRKEKWCRVIGLRVRKLEHRVP